LKAKTSDLVVLMFAVAISSSVGHTQQPQSTALAPADVSLYARLLQLADQRKFDGALVREGIASKSTAIRWATSLTLAQLVAAQRDSVLPVLRELATSGDTALAGNAAFGLGLAKDSVAIPALSTLALRGGPVGKTAAWSLGEIGAPARDTIASLLREDKVPAIVTAELLYAMAKIRPLDLGAVSIHIRSRNLAIRGAAVYAIARQGVPGGVRPLLTLSSRDDAFIRSQIARALRRSAAGDSLEAEALQTLAALSRDDYASVRISAIYSLASYGSLANDVILRTITDRDPNVRIAAAQAAGYTVGPDSAEWERLWNIDTSFAYRVTVLESSVRSGVPLPVLNSWRTHSNWRYRAAYVRAWAASPDTVEAKVVALIASYDLDSKVRSAAYETFVATDPDREDSVAQRVLTEAMYDPDPVAREAVPWYKRPPTAIDSTHANRPVEWYENVVREVVVPTIEGPPLGATIETERGTIRLSLLGLHAPLTVYNFISLAQQGFYSVTRFHRVVPNFVAQDGDPRGDGNGGPGYAIRDEFNREPYTRGAVGMATAGPDTGGSQYFLTLSPQPHLDGHYTIFARVVTGMAVMDALVQGDLVKSISVP
jgi:cyclophilin family peptidyl-prolyl cis-trans isomerase/HEAT repeat protein